MRWNGGRPRDRGTAAVEFALVLPVALLVIFGIIDFGRMFNAQITLTEATRESARAAALIGDSAAQDRFDAIAGPVFGSINPSIVSCAPGDIDSDAEVDVSYVFPFVTPLSVIIGSTTLSAHAEMPCLH
jgi:Flp pilus assembly protein TadG